MKKKKIEPGEKKAEQLSPKLRKIIGAVKVKSDFDEKKELEEYFNRKYLHL